MASGIFVGLSTIDLVHTVDEFPLADTKAVARSQEVLVGGPATNAAITFSLLGGKATLVTGVGRHPVAGLVKDELRRYAVDLVDLAPQSELFPAISSVWINQYGHRSVVSVNATRIDISGPQVDHSLFREASILLVDGHFMSACQVWAAAARTLGIPVVFDGGSWKPGTDQLLNFVDIAICSADFLPPSCNSDDTVINYLQSADVRQIAITHGATPVRFVDTSHSGFIEVPQVDAIDTTGAGDIFHGAFCFHTANGSSFVEALREAARIATASCQFHGTREWMSVR
jgi:sugar/nucleoside kinase (ribokinase family)